MALGGIMALSIEYSGAGNTAAGGAGVVSSASFTITSANKLIVAVGFGKSSSVPITAATWNGGSSFHANVIAGADIHDGSWNQATFLYLDNPTPGTGVVTVTAAADITGGIGVVTFIDAAAGAPPAGETSGTSSTPSVTVAGSASGDIVVSAVTSDLGSSGTTTADGTGVVNLSDPGGDIDFNLQYQTATGANTVCSWSQSGSDVYVAAGVAIADAGGGGTNTDYSPAKGTATLTGLAALVNPQFARPSADATDGAWTPSTGADLYAVLDEAVADTGDYIESAANPSGDSCTIKLATISDPGTDNGFQLQTVAGATGSTGTVVVSLRQGNAPGSEIAAWTHSSLPVGSYTTFHDAVSAAQAANITDFADLYVRFVAS